MVIFTKDPSVIATCEAWLTSLLLRQSKRCNDRPERHRMNSPKAIAGQAWPVTLDVTRWQGMPDFYWLTIPNGAGAPRLTTHCGVLCVNMMGLGFLSSTVVLCAPQRACGGGVNSGGVLGPRCSPTELNPLALYKSRPNACSAKMTVRPVIPSRGACCVSSHFRGRESPAVQMDRAVQPSRWAPLATLLGARTSTRVVYRSV